MASQFHRQDQGRRAAAGSLDHFARIQLWHYIWLLASFSLYVGCGRNAMWSTPDTFSVPLALATPSVTTNEFTLRSACYDVYLTHQGQCPVILHHINDLMPYPKQIACDVSVVIRRGGRGAILFQQQATNAGLETSGSYGVRYGLGSFETAFRGSLLMVVSNSPSQHGDAVCHARVDIIEKLLK